MADLLNLETASSTIFGLAAAIAEGVNEVGGKAYNLAQLDRVGIDVPRAFVIGAVDHDKVIGDPEVAPLVAQVRLARERGEPVPDGTLERLGRAIEGVAPSPAEVAALRAMRTQAGLDGCLVAVRSSAAAEDGTKYSFAGVHHSDLCVSSDDDDAVWASIRRCQASFWSRRAIDYRLAAGVPDDAFRGAVLICAMIGDQNGHPDASGVLFTLDPRTGNEELLLIEAKPGLGDDLVSGKVTPASGSYNLSTGSWQASGAMGELLSKAHAEKLVRAALRVRDALAFGDDLMHFDIEWALHGGAIHILQARPITARAVIAAAKVPEIWSRANLIEVLPEIPTPLSWSLVRPGVRWTLLEPYRPYSRGVAEAFPLLKRIAGRPFLELSALQYISYVFFGLSPARLNQSLGGHQPEIPVAPFKGGLLTLCQRGMRAARYGQQIVKLRKLLQPALDQSKKLEAELLSADLEQLPLSALAEHWLRIATFTQGASLGKAAAAPLPWINLAGAILRKSPDDPEVLDLIGGLLAGRGAVVSADHGYALVALGRITQPDERAAALKAFLAQFGHRAFDELDLASPRWREEPESIDRLAASMADAPDPKIRTAARQHDGQAKFKALPWHQRLGIRFLMPRMADAFALREEARSESVRLLSMLRVLALEVGRRLFVAGKLDNREDVFQLTIADMIAYLEAEWDGTGARALAADRHAICEKWRSLEAPAIVGDSVPAAEAAPQSPPAKAVQKRDGRTLAGLGVSPGVVSGNTRILHSPADAGKFLPGDIIVAASTDPSWTPLFLKAGGLIIEHGGYLSHGAIVAREFGIPAVVNVPHALTAIADGEQATIDGAAGTIALARSPR